MKPNELLGIYWQGVCEGRYPNPVDYNRHAEDVTFNIASMGTPKDPRDAQWIQATVYRFSIAYMLNFANLQNL